MELLMLMPKSVTARFACISAAIVTACLVYPSAARQVHLRPAEQPATPATPTTLANLSELERQRLIVQITEIANQTANEKSWFEQDLRPLIIRVGLNIESNGIAFDMEGRLSHEAGFDDMADLHRAIENRILTLEGAGEINVFEWTYGGRPLDEILRNVEPTPAPLSRRKRAAEPTEAVIVAAGHGRYYHHGYKDWRPHREVSNGILEDDMTPKFARELSHYLRLLRFNAVELRADWRGNHEPSGLPWGNLGARYFLEQWKPALPQSIWHSLPAAMDPGRERREDILSRPLYANHVGADTIIHLHTNADTNSAISGLRVLIHPDRQASANLGKLALCSMKEMIHSIDRFKAFSVAKAPHVVNDKAENAKATMPSIIVETGFHTNPSDAELIKDTEFQRTSMMGLAKAYRLFKEGRECEEFKIENMADLIETVGKDAQMPVSLRGNPVYPLRIRYLPSRCYREPCTADSASIGDLNELGRFRIRRYCRRDDVEKGPIEYLVSVQDFWGARTEPKTFRLTCLPKTRRKGR